jgi:hypothetical protein
MAELMNCEQQVRHQRSDFLTIFLLLVVANCQHAQHDLKKERLTQYQRWRLSIERSCSLTHTPGVRGRPFNV